MRMWMINPKMMCNKHLIEEHAGLHKFLSNIKFKSCLKRAVESKRIELISYQERHDLLEKEITNRNNKTKPTPITMPDLSHIEKEYFIHIDRAQSIRALCTLCNKCADKMSVKVGFF